MKKSSVISLKAHKRLLDKARAYLSAPDQLIREGNRAVDLLIQALDAADPDLRLKIVLMLGTAAGSKVIWTLYGILADQSQSGNLRHAAAVQLSLVAGSGSRNQVAALTERLIADLSHEDSEMRAYAAFALGWEGNQPAVPALLELLEDEDAEVQQAAVSALSNIRDERLFARLADRLVCGPKEQQRAVLYHLGCFPSKRRELIRICRRYLSHPDADLRYDALVVLESVHSKGKSLRIFLNCLKDPDARICEQALAYLAGTQERWLKPLAPRIRTLLHASSPHTRQAAIRLMRHISEGPSAV